MAELRTALEAAPEPRRLSDPQRRPSAVLAAVYEHEERPHVLLTRRSWDLRSHRGEVSFPGGRAEPSDADLVATALRESAEEVGIAPASVEVLAELDHLATVTSMSFIVPYVGMLQGRPELRPDPREVEEVLHVPVELLLADGVYREEVWARGGIERPIWFFELPGDTVWGATASMLRQLLCLAVGIEGGEAEELV